MTESSPEPAALSASDPQARRLARMAAIQGLYQMTLIDRKPQQIIREFRDHPLALLSEMGLGEEGMQADPVIDRSLFGSIVTGVAASQDEIDAMIAAAADAKFSVARLEVLLRSILRAGAFELHHHGKTATGIIINDYVDITHAFFNAKEPGLVNAILDKIAKNIR